MPFFPQDPSHRAREERLDALAGRTLASPTLRAIWNHADRLRAIDAAERIRSRGSMTAIEHYQVSAALNGRTPDEARAASRVQFECEYEAAVASERLAA